MSIARLEPKGNHQIIHDNKNLNYLAKGLKEMLLGNRQVSNKDLVSSVIKAHDLRIRHLAKRMKKCGSGS